MGQEGGFMPLNRAYLLRIEPFLYKTDTAIHTAIKPYLISEVDQVINTDSIYSRKLKDTLFNRKWITRKLFNEHLLQIQKEDYALFLDPVFEFRAMNENDNSNNFLYINSRGFQTGGKIGKRFSFYSSFYESQARFPSFIDSLVRATRIVPGGGRIKRFYSSDFDYAIASGYINYTLNRHFNFQFGHDKNFIGDGYRSLLLSDYPFNYPFLKITSTFWKIKYVNLYTQMQDMRMPVAEEESYIKKYGSFHYLSLNIGKRTSVGIMEAIIWKSDSVRNRNIDLNYLNPVIFFRPVEFSLNSPDNALLGFNIRHTIVKNHVIYGQMMLDEFKISEVKSQNGWWANKQAYQLGYKAFNLFNMEGLHLLTEFNYVRPYTYQHKSSLTAFTHDNQSLAHPLGANFYEWITILNGKYKYLNAEFKVALVKIGYDKKDSTGTKVNYGQNVLSSYLTHPYDYGNSIAQGLTTKMVYAEARIWYLFNPKTNFIVEAGVINRRTENATADNNSLIFYLGLRTALTNRYFDF